MARNQQVEYHVIADDKLKAWTMGSFPTYKMAVDAIEDFKTFDEEFQMNGYYTYHVMPLMK